MNKKEKKKQPAKQRKAGLHAGHGQSLVYCGMYLFCDRSGQ